MLILLLLMLLLSLKCVRDKHYDLFWATHLLFLPFICLLMIHPLRLVCIILLIFIRLIKVSFLKALSIDFSFTFYKNLVGSNTYLPKQITNENQSHRKQRNAKALSLKDILLPNVFLYNFSITTQTFC